MYKLRLGPRMLKANIKLIGTTGFLVINRKLLSNILKMFMCYFDLYDHLNIYIYKPASKMRAEEEYWISLYY
jgi:hypothetical protein